MEEFKNLYGYAFRQSYKDPSEMDMCEKNRNFITILNLNKLNPIQSKSILVDRDT